MLIITRKNNESLYIGEDIKITVFRTQDGRAKIGIDAPSEVKIVREELEREKEE